MSVRFSVTLTNAEAKAVLGSEGLTSGYGIKRSIPLRSAELKLIGAIQESVNNMNARKGADHE